jgi:shikimate dehydrogenase
VRRLAGVIGWPLDYTRSPALHQAAYDAMGFDGVYLALPVPPDRLAEAVAGVRALGFLGVNVTVPHKEAIVPLCDEIDASARAVGAVNTVVVRDRRLVGSNTDVVGFARSIAGAAEGGGRAVVLGAGGAARAVCAALRGRETIVVARDPVRAAAITELGVTVVPWKPAILRDALAGAGLVVDATSAGLDDAAWPAPVPLDVVGAETLVCSLVYHREPAILREARARGLSTIDGGPMLVHQAAEAVRLMTGGSVSVAVLSAALR